MCGGLSAYLGKKGKASPSRGGRSRTHVRRAGAGCPFRWTTPLRVSGYSVVRLAQEYKRAAPIRKRLLNDWTYVSPSYAIEGTSWGSVAIQLKDWAFSIWAMVRPRDVRRPLRSSECRCARQLYA